MGKIIKAIARRRDQSTTKPKNKTLKRAEERGSLALITETTRGETKETAFMEIKKAKAVPKKAINETNQNTSKYQEQRKADKPARGHC